MSWIETSVVCPFYVGMTQKEIICEGMTENCRVRMRFDSVDFRREYMSATCSGGVYNTCHIAKANYMKHGELDWLYRSPDEAMMKNERDVELPTEEECSCEWEV